MGQWDRRDITGRFQYGPLCPLSHLRGAYTPWEKISGCFGKIQMKLTALLSFFGLVCFTLTFTSQCTPLPPITYHLFPGFCFMLYIHEEARNCGTRTGCL